MRVKCTEHVIQCHLWCGSASCLGFIVEQKVHGLELLTLVTQLCAVGLGEGWAAAVLLMERLWPEGGCLCGAWGVGLVAGLLTEAQPACVVLQGLQT